MRSFTCFAARVLLWGSVVFSTWPASASERLTLPDHESSFDNPIPPMPKPLREKQKQISGTKKDVEKGPKEEKTEKKAEGVEAQSQKSDKKQDAGAEHNGEISKESEAQKPSHGNATSLQSKERDSTQGGVSQDDKIPGTQVIIAREKNVPVESRTGWYWFLAALGVLLLVFFGLA
jgi:hypothetical protein